MGRIPFDYALLAFFFGLAAAGIGALFRALPWPDSLKARKPWNCAACTSGWGAIIALAIAHPAFTWQEYLLVGLAATGLSTYLLSQCGIFFSDPLAEFRDEPPAALTQREDSTRGV